MLIVLVLLVVGVLLGRLRSIPSDAPRALDQVVLWFSLPGLVLTVIPQLEFDGQALVPVAVAWGSLAVLAVLVLLAGRVFGWSRRVVGTLLVVVPLGNTSFLGIPAVTELLSPAHVPYAVVYDQLGSFLALATWGSVVAVRRGGGQRPSPSATVGRVLTFPPFVALVAALVVRQVGMPEVLDDLAGRAAATLVPLTMLVVGMRLRLPRRLAGLGPIVVGLLLRMVVAPAIVLAIVALGDVDSMAWQTSTLEVGMPPMVTAAIVATAAGLDEELASALVGVGVLASLATLPLLARLIT